MTYLTIDDPDALLGMKKRKKEDFLYKDMEIVECPKCRGYGGWHLHLNAYGEGKHFDASCSQCNGWGYVEKGSKDESCVHDWKELPGEAMCQHLYECTQCGQQMRTDSSD